MILKIRGVGCVTTTKNYDQQALAQHHTVFIDQIITVGTRWAERIEAEFHQADFLIVFLSEHSVHSEMVEAEIATANRIAKQQGGKPMILPVRLAYLEPFQYSLSAYLDAINWAFWRDAEDTLRLIAELMQAICGGELAIANPNQADLLQPREASALPQPFPSAQPISLEMPEGTMDGESQFYVERDRDVLALNAIHYAMGEFYTVVIWRDSKQLIYILL